jgi:HD-GYP domain-containing protein (c-di-GMP phosphodiesterase class II)
MRAEKEEPRMSRDDQLQSLPVASARILAEQGEADFSIYLPRSAADAPVLYRKAGAVEARPDFHRLHDSGVSHILVRGADLARCEEALEQNLDSVLHDPTIEPLQKVQCVQHVGTSVVRDILSGESVSTNIDRASNLLDIVIEGVLSDRMVAANLLSMSEHHRTTASHMFAVSTLAVLLGAEVFGPVHTTLRELGLAGMLHDLGKITIDPEVLNKPTPLTPAELELIRHHPVESIRLIGDHPDATTTVRQMVLQHHERPDGRGYPLGLTDEALLTGSKILAIVDSFHAMIGRRVYRGSLEPADALRQLKFQSGRQFDAGLLATWEELFNRCWKIATVSKSLETGVSDVGSAYHDDHRNAPVGDTPRRQDRRPCREKAKVRCVYAGRLTDASAAPDEFVSPLHDLSRGGVCLFVTHPMYRGEVVHLLIETAGTKTWVSGVVRWCRKEQDGPRFKVGIKFDGRIPEDRATEREVVKGLDDPELFPLTSP